MNVECVIDGIRYTLSNDNLKVGDKVFPIASGRINDKNEFILHYLEFDKYHYTKFKTDFPEEPHILLDLNHSDYKPYQVRTNLGYGPIEKYYKIIKKEHQIKQNDGMFTRYKWVEIND